MPRPEVVVAYDLKGDPITLAGEDRFLHMCILGSTGTGKSSRLIKPMVYSDLQKIADGVPMSITLIEPKGSLARDIAAMARKMGIRRVVLIDPEDPDTDKFNPLQGPADDVAESTRTVLRATFGKQDAFFAQAQETHSRNAVLLLKALRGDQLTMLDLVRLLRDQEALYSCVQDLKRMGGDEDLIFYFEKEVFGELKSKFHQFAMGLRLQLEDLLGNRLLRNVFQGNSSVMMHEHLETPGVLVVNTSMGALKKLGDTFGQFVIMHLQNAVFSRPGNEFTRQTHVNYIDEFPRYINPDFERSLAVGREFRNAVVMAAQGTDQMVLTEKQTFRNIVLNCARNHIIFGGMIYDDAKFFADMFGKVDKQYTEASYRDNPFEIMPWLNKKVNVRTKEVHRYPPTYIQDMNKLYGKHRVLVRICQDGVADFPREAEVYRLDEMGIDLDAPNQATSEQGILGKLKSLLFGAPPDSPTDHGNTTEQTPQIEPASEPEPAVEPAPAPAPAAVESSVDWNQVPRPAITRPRLRTGPNPNQLGLFDRQEQTPVNQEDAQVSQEQTPEQVSILTEIPLAADAQPESETNEEPAPAGTPAQTQPAASFKDSIMLEHAVDKLVASAQPKPKPEASQSENPAAGRPKNNLSNDPFFTGATARK